MGALKSCSYSGDHSFASCKGELVMLIRAERIIDSSQHGKA